MSRSNKFVPHFHIPLQSGSNRILKLMKRRYLRELYVNRVNTIKTLAPNCCIGVDVIVGFPGETEDDFLETYTFLNELNISYLLVFTYSKRVNTPAADMLDPVPLKVRNERSKMLRSLSEKKRRRFYEENLNVEDYVLWEDDQEDGKMLGFTRNYIKVAAKYDPIRINEVEKVCLKLIYENGKVEVEQSDSTILA